MKYLSLICLCFLVFGSVSHVLTKPPLLQEVGFSQAVYDEQNNLLRLTLSSDEKYRVYASLEEISPWLVQTTLLQEDRYFFYHPGFNPVAILKAAWQTYVLRTRQVGASTITMQVARIRYGIHSKSITGKLHQIIKALQLELLYTKKQILEAYLNLASYGSNIEGVGAASLIYFEKPASQLNLAEAIKLSVVPQNPTRRLPTAPNNQIELQKAYRQLFHRWLARHPEDHAMKNLMDLPPQLIKKNLPFYAPHLVDSVLRTTHEPMITTTLNLRLQTLIEKVICQYLKENRQQGINNAALMLIDTRDMGVKALVGSGNYFDSIIRGQVNGTKAKRSPGSTLKPFIYALAMEQGLIHPLTVLKDAPSSFGDYNPENFDKDFMGPLPAKEALVLSRNIPAIFLANQLKNPTFYQFLQQARVDRLKSSEEYGLSLVLGSAEVTMEELVCLYALLANQGIWQPVRLTDTQPLEEGIRLLSREASFLTLDMLRDTGKPYAAHFPVYWKTGTSSGYRDAWSIGVFGPYVLAIWIGDFSAKSNPSFIGATAAAPLFFSIIDALHKQIGNMPDLVQATPDMNLTKVEVCRASGLLPNACCPETVRTWFIPGKSPIKRDQVHREIAIDSATGLRTSHIDEKTQFCVYEFWPSDILKIFEQAGIKRSLPPPYDPESHSFGNIEGDPPQIISPQQGICYTIRLNKPGHILPFSAIADADVQTLYWFVDNHFIGSSERDQSISWEAKSGIYKVRVVDNYGRAAVSDLVVRAIE